MFFTEKPIPLLQKKAGLTQRLMKIEGYPRFRHSTTLLNLPPRPLLPLPIGSLSVFLV
jgi:hypothetical protein